MNEEYVMKDFEKWWNQEGKEIEVENQECTEDMIHRISGIAWSNGAFKARRTCETCVYFKEGNCFEKISESQFEEEEESWENIERYFQKEKTDFCSNHEDSQCLY